MCFVVPVSHLKKQALARDISREPPKGETNSGTTLTAVASYQWRSQDFLKEGSEFHGGPQGTPYQKLKTYRIWPTIFWKGPNLTN